MDEKQYVTTSMMTEVTPGKEVDSICRWAAARAVVLVNAPKFTNIALIANDVYMVQAIARAHGKNPTVGAITGFLVGLGGTLIKSLVVARFSSRVLNTVCAAAMTFAVGKVAEQWVKEDMPLVPNKDWIPMLEEGLAQTKIGLANMISDVFEGRIQTCPLGDETKDMLQQAGITMADALESAKDTMTAMFGGECPMEKLGKGAAIAAAGVGALFGASKLMKNVDVTEKVEMAKGALSGIATIVADTMSHVPDAWTTTTIAVKEKADTSAVIAAVKEHLSK